MCIQCNNSLSDDQILHQLNVMLNCKEEDFNNFNTTSILHITIYMSGCHGVVCKEVSIKLIQRFLTWYEKNKEDNYFPILGIEKMFPKKCFYSVLETVNNNPNLPNKELLPILFENFDKKTSSLSCYNAQDTYNNIFIKKEICLLS